MTGCVSTLATSRKRQVAALLSFATLQLVASTGFSAHAVTVDDTRPSRLGAVSTTPTSVSLTWTAVGHDGAAVAATYYDLRYATAMITEETWEAATRAPDEPAPQAAGETDTCTVTDLAPATTYYFALKVCDAVAHWSALSNLASATTQPLPDSTAVALSDTLVVEPGDLTMHLDDLLIMRRWKGFRQYGVCWVWIHDQAGQPVSGAVVHVSYTGPSDGTTGAVTGPDGLATLASTTTEPCSGEWCFTVTSLTHEIYTHDPSANLVTSACRSGPLPLDSSLPSTDLSVGERDE